MTDLQTTLAGRLARLHDIRRWVIAFSGGVDSRVLLELCARQFPAERLLALHIDHQLQADSGRWAEQCEATCARLGVPFSCIAVEPASAAEADLRTVRYGAFLSVLRQGDCLLLAQHADDQAETLIMRLMRGAGVRGLAGMPRQRPLGPALLLRPLLDQPRATLERWAREQGLAWVEDPSNADQGYGRNWVRHNLMPLLRGRWPQLAQRVSAATRQLSEASDLLDEIARDDLASLQQVPERVSLVATAPLSEARRRNLLRYWVHRECGHWLSGDELAHLERQVIAAGGDRSPELQFGRFRMRRYRDELYLLPEPPSPGEAFELEVAEREWMLPQGRLSFRPGVSGGFAVGTRLYLGYRHGGERLRPSGRGGSVSLKQLLQESGVPPWLRAGWPLLWLGDELAAVPGVCLCEGVNVADGLVPFWQPFGLSGEGCFGRL